MSRLAQLGRPAIWSYGAQRLCTWAPLRRLLSRGLAMARPAFDGPTSDASRRLAMELQCDGIAPLKGFVGEAEMRRIRAHLDGAPLQERFASRRHGFTLDSVPENVHVAEYDIGHVLACPEVMNIANHPDLLAAAAQYLGCAPTISNISIWWSLPADGSAQEAENYHRDVDDWRFVKFFLYLSDVDAGAGPHRFVKGSHRKSNFLRIRRIADSEVARAYPPEEHLQIEGRAGDAFLEDTFGLHKGQPPVTTRRLLLQVQYSINPIAVYSYPRSTRAGDKALPMDRYINRLYV